MPFRRLLPTRHPHIGSEVRVKQHDDDDDDDNRKKKMISKIIKYFISGSRNIQTQK